MTNCAMKATAMNIPPQRRVAGSVGRSTRDRFGSSCAPSRSCRKINIAPNRKSAGIARRSRFPNSCCTPGMTSIRSPYRSMLVSSWTTPRAMAPAKVAGRLLSRPTIAAAYALRTRKVRMIALSCWPLAKRIPDSAASAEPSIHDADAIRVGRAPDS